jgi:hypothetical protein
MQTGGFVGLNGGAGSAVFDGVPTDLDGAPVFIAHLQSSESEAVRDLVDVAHGGNPPNRRRRKRRIPAAPARSRDRLAREHPVDPRGLLDLRHVSIGVLAASRSTATFWAAPPSRQPSIFAMSGSSCPSDTKPSKPVSETWAGRSGPLKNAVRSSARPLNPITRSEPGAEGGAAARRRRRRSTSSGRSSPGVDKGTVTPSSRRRRGSFPPPRRIRSSHLIPLTCDDSQTRMHRFARADSEAPAPPSAHAARRSSPRRRAGRRRPSGASPT